MKDIMAVIGKVLGIVFAVLVIAYTSLLTFQVAGRLTPGNVITQAMTLVLFDIAALVWFVQFTTQAKGTAQWAIAGIGFAVGLVGSIIMAAGELLLGQNLVVIDDPSKIGWILVFAVIIAALCHAILTYTFHFADPQTANRIENAQQVSKAMADAYQAARQQIERDTPELTAALRESVMYEAKQLIQRETIAHVRRANDIERDANPRMIEGSAKEPAPAEQPAHVSQIMTAPEIFAPSPNGHKAEEAGRPFSR